jgi:hypothetical protein
MKPAVSAVETLAQTLRMIAFSITDPHPEAFLP